MNARKRQRIETWAANGLLCFAVGLRLTLWVYDHVSFFLKGATARRLREADRAARRERAA